MAVWCCTCGSDFSAFMVGIYQPGAFTCLGRRAVGRTYYEPSRSAGVPTTRRGYDTARSCGWTDVDVGLVDSPYRRTDRNAFSCLRIPGDTRILPRLESAHFSFG